MATPDEIAVVTANGTSYQIWTDLEVTRSAEDVVDHGLLSVAEISPGAATLAAVKLQPGDVATVTLAGQPALKGLVYLRQGAMDPEQHVVQIGISSLAQSIMASTVDGMPGQYVNQTLQQIGSAVFGKVGVNFKMTASGDMPFPRVSEHVGETRFSFIERLCRMRNAHMIDDGQGGIVAFRGPDASGLTLTEGVDIIRGRILLKNNDHVDTIGAYGHDANNDSADQNRAPKGNATVDPPIGRPSSLIAEEMGNSAAMQLRANHEADWDKFQQVDGDITVQGWLAPDGALWMAKVKQQLTVVSPSLLPNNSFKFMIKGVMHRQSDAEGTTTIIQLCRADGLGAGAEPLTNG